MFKVTTNEWYSVDEAMPPAGRFVQCVKDKILKNGNIEEEFITAAWNGAYWINQKHCRLDPKEGVIVAWYMFEKFIRKDVL